MGRKATPGLFKRGKIWNIDKQIFGQRIRESTGTDSLIEAESYLSHRIEELRQASIYGIRPQRTFQQAATKFLLEHQHKASIADDALHLKLLCSYIGTLDIAKVHIGTLQSFIEARKKQGRKTKTINSALGVVRHILNLAATEWIDENGLTWLLTAPKIRLLPVHDAKKPYPLSWDEQDQLFDELPEHLQQMATFKVNTGCREQEVCRLKWEWEVKIPELQTSVFIIPSYELVNEGYQRNVKNGEDRLVVLNQIAKNIIERMRTQNSEYVFTFRGKPLTKMNNSAWKRARKKVGLEHVRIHDLKHTFGRRLRAAGVGVEDRQDLLGHKSGKITTHYSAAELCNLIKAANLVTRNNQNSPVITLLRSTPICRKSVRENANPHNIPTLMWGNQVVDDTLVSI